MINILLADDHELIRKGMRSLLEDEPDFCIVAEAANGNEVSRLVPELKPDLLVLDLNMPGIGGLDLIPQLKKILPDVKIVVLTMYSNEVYVIDALQSGADGYVLKEDAATELITAIRDVVRGRLFLCSALAQRAYRLYSNKVRSADEMNNLLSSLTVRERQILQLITEEGLTNAQIGERLFISRRTVEIHRASMMKKLGFKSYSDLVQLAILRGLLPSKTGAELAQKEVVS